MRRLRTLPTRRLHAAGSCLVGVVLAVLVGVGASGQTPSVAPPSRLPDLVVQRIEFMDCVPRLGVTLYNQGGTAISTAFDVRLVSVAARSGDSREAKQRIGGLGAFSAARLIFDLPVAESFVATADAGDVVREANEANNALQVSARSMVRCPTVGISGASAPRGAALRFPVRLSHAFSQPVTVRVRTEDGSATGADFGLIAGSTGPTHCGADFIRGNASLEFPAGTSELTQFFSVTTCADPSSGGDETFVIRVTEVVNGTVRADGATAVGTILSSSP
jgi:hypothetical protein